MSKLSEIAGPALVAWLADQPRERLPMLAGHEYADDNDVWSIAGVDGETVLLRAQDDQRMRRCHFQVLAAGTLYVAGDHPLHTQLRAARSPFDRLTDEARQFLQSDNPCGNASLADTEAVALYRLLKAWRTDGELPSLEQADQLLQWAMRSRPVSRQACALLRAWETAVARTAARVDEQPQWLVRLVQLLRAAGQSREAATRLHELGAPAAWRHPDALQIVLLVEYAGALMDLHQQVSDRAYLDRAHKMLRVAWARQRPNELVSRAFNRHEALLSRLDGSITGA